MGSFNLNIPSLGSSFVDYRTQILGDSFNWSWVRPLTQIGHIAIHHSAGPDTQTPDDIANYHVRVRGWGGIGYHFVVTKDGKVWYVGDLTTARANVYGQNQSVIGICLIGTFMSGRLPTNDQIDSTHKLCSHLLFNTPEIPGINGWEDIRGHKELTATECPGETWGVYRSKIIQGVNPPPNSDRVNQITSLYNVVLGRTPDQDGLNWYVNGDKTIDEIRKDMTESSEHRQILSMARSFKDARNLAQESLENIGQVANKIDQITKL